MKIGLLITARMGSTRLRDKHLRDIGGRPALSYLLDRITREFRTEVDSEQAIVLIATGNKTSNEPLAQLCTDDVGIFFGDDENVPLRHLQCAQAHGFDALLPIDGDDLFCTPEALRDTWELLRAGAQVARTTGLPLGMNAWGYGTGALRAALNGAPQKLLETGWGRIFEGTPAREVALECPGADKVRATLDYDDDLTFFTRAICDIPGWDAMPAQVFVRHLIDSGINEINLGLNEQYWKNFSSNIQQEDQKDNLVDYSKRLNAVIPGGAHTYSRGDDQYPSNAPQILERGKGARVWSPDGREFLDYGMALRAVSIGYSEPEINEAAIRGLELGNNLTRASTIELEAAELLVSLVDSVDMVKFTKNGSTATSAAVKLARAYTGRDLVVRCAQHPFFSFDDWFIASTPITKGIPRETIEQIKQFTYNDIASLEAVIAENPGRVACVILEPAASETPAGHGTGAPRNFLQEVEALCKQHGIVFILDEMITGFRWHMKGAQHVYGVTPDLCTFGKAMANGFSVAAVAGRRELMELGSIDKPGQERLFLLSTTHGAEMSGLAAFTATMKFLERHQVIDHLWRYGESVVSLINRVAAEHGLQDRIKAAGPAVSPYYLTMNESGQPSMELRTLFSQEMIRNGVLMPWLAFSYRHGDAELALTERALHATMEICAKAVEQGLEKYLVGPAIKPVFRRHN